MEESLADRIVRWIIEEAKADRLNQDQLWQLHEVFGDAGLPTEIDEAYVRQTKTTIKMPIYSGPLPPKDKLDAK